MEHHHKRHLMTQEEIAHVADEMLLVEGKLVGWEAVLSRTAQSDPERQDVLGSPSPTPVITDHKTGGKPPRAVAREG